MAVTRNMNPKKCPMPSQEPDVRNKNFDEVALGYTYDMAVSEAKRCLNCPTKPCRSACPVQIDIPAFIERVANEDMEGAYRVLTASSALPAVCGRVCPQENQCEGKCVRGIKGESVAIGRLERFVADWHREHVADHPQAPAPNGHKVAIIGAGPSGLTAAGDLAKLGYQVTIYEALHLAGGVLVYGIPEFRLPKAIVQKEIDGLKAMGVDIETNMVIGKVLTIDELFEMGYEAVYVASGAGLPRFMGIPGESLKGVYSANEYLTRINLMKAYRADSKTPIRHSGKVAVVGALGQASGRERGVHRLSPRHGGASGSPGGGRARRGGGHHLQDPHQPGRGAGQRERRGLRHALRGDGAGRTGCFRPPPSDRQGGQRHGCIVTNGEDGLTSREGVYAGGDAVTGAATVILAMGAGKHAAKAIDEYIMEMANVGGAQAKPQTAAALKETVEAETVRR